MSSRSVWESGSAAPPTAICVMINHPPGGARPSRVCAAASGPSAHALKGVALIYAASLVCEYYLPCLVTFPYDVNGMVAPHVCSNKICLNTKVLLSVGVQNRLNTVCCNISDDSAPPHSSQLVDDLENRENTGDMLVILRYIG